ncbi:hypothetical protein T03_8600 [Trichinella britovi]|uniref:Uncharacterized protein n=1 Tax=Trichinella britovi TaxID=45882 RepID=A0A0V0YVP4_TRIBR|nr:hypothetical protein T03_8600 [Trichinella britovi]
MNSFYHCCGIEYPVEYDEHAKRLARYRKAREKTQKDRESFFAASITGTN